MAKEESLDIERQIVKRSDSASAINEKRIDKSAVTYVDGFKEEDHISIESETNEYVLKQPPDGGKAWLVLFGCFCVSNILK
jgi:hypothetical protein